MAAPDQEVERFGIVWAGWMGGWEVEVGWQLLLFPLMMRRWAEAGCPTVLSAESYTTAVCAKALTTSDSCKS